MQVLHFLLQTVAGFFTMALLARFAMQWARAPFRNPIGQFIIAVTDWCVRPARRLIPTAWGHDLPSLVLAWLVQILHLAALYAIGGFLAASPGQIVFILLAALIDTAVVGCNLIFFVVIVSALLSWINPQAPIAPVINAVAGPFLRPFQRVIPLIGGIDVSPIALIFAIKLVEVALASLRNALLYA